MEMVDTIMNSEAFLALSLHLHSTLNYKKTRNCMKYFLFIVTVFSMCLFACKPKPIRIKVPQQDPKLSVFTYGIPDGGIIVVITKTFTSFIDPNKLGDDTTGTVTDLYLVAHARATINYNGNIDTLQNLGDGAYLTPLNFQFLTYQNYQLEVYDSTTKQTISANSIMQPNIDFASIIVSKSTNPNDTSFTFDYSFKDDKTMENYYMINVSDVNAETSFNINSSFKGKSKSHLELLNDQTAQLIDLPNTNESLLKGSFTISTLKYDLNARDTLIMSISAVDKKYYEFLSIYKRNGSILNQLTGEPINLPSNIKNGYGYFSTHFLSYAVKDLNEL
jgi:hypothetical protein